MTDNVPSADVIEDALRGTVRECFSKNDLESLTVKRVRTAAQIKLDLQEDFFKSHVHWKGKSGEIIKDEVHRQEQARETSSNGLSSKQSQERSPQPTPSPSQSKRKPPQPTEKERSRKRQKRASRDASSDQTSDDGKLPADAEAEDIISSEDDEESVANSLAGQPSESELSSLIDDVPPPRKQKAKPAKPARIEQGLGAASKASKPDSKSTSLGPQEEEIKRLQSQLVKCGVRKLWGKELKPLETSRDKISHLKSMLADVGMSGRFSEEKARQIKERRELAADLEAIQEGDRIWGNDDPEDANNTKDTGKDARPRRKTAAQNLTELDQFDDEEDDDSS